MIDWWQNGGFSTSRCTVSVFRSEGRLRVRLYWGDPVFTARASWVDIAAADLARAILRGMFKFYRARYFHK